MVMVIRDLTLPDIPAACELLNLMSPSDRRQRWRTTLGEPGTRAVVADDDGQVVGAAVLATAPNFRRTASAGLAVAKPSRGKGVGSAMAKRIIEFARQAVVPMTTITLRDDLAEGRRFAERFGFTVVAHCTGWIYTMGSAVTLRADAESAARRAGIHIRTTNLSTDRAHFIAIAQDAISGTPTDFPIDMNRFAAGMPHDSVIVTAFDGNGPAGVSLIRPSGDTGGWHTSFTGVLPRHRRRGVARALKLATFIAATDRGGSSMHAENDDRNAPMLALNASVGMTPGVGYWTFSAISTETAEQRRVSEQRDVRRPTETVNPSPSIDSGHLPPATSTNRHGA